MATQTRTTARSLSVGDRFRLHLSGGRRGVTLWRVIDRTDSDQIVAVGEAIPELLWPTMAEIFEPAQPVLLAVIHRVTFTATIEGGAVEVTGMADDFELAAHSATLGWLDIVGFDPAPERVSREREQETHTSDLSADSWAGLVMVARALEPVWGPAQCVSASADLAIEDVAGNGGPADA